MRGLNGGRINIASCSLGAAMQALAVTAQYLKEREAFKQKLINFQVGNLIEKGDSINYIIAASTIQVSRHGYLAGGFQINGAESS